MLGEFAVQLILHHPRLDADDPVFDVDLEDTVHVPRGVDHEPVPERLTVRARRAAARADHDFGEARIVQQAGDAHEVVAGSRESHGAGLDLIDRVVGGKDRAVGGRERQIAFEAPRQQFGAGGLVEGDRIGGAGENRDHGTRSTPGGSRGKPKGLAPALPVRRKDRNREWA